MVSFFVSGSEASREPFFDESVPHNVSALIGKTAFLTCVVKNLGKTKSVSGTQHKDFAHNRTLFITRHLT